MAKKPKAVSPNEHDHRAKYGSRYEHVPIDSVHLDPSNVRRHSQKNIEAIKSSLLRFGMQRPIVVDAGGKVLAGNGTLQAAMELGWTEIDIVRSDLTGADASAFAIADNRTAELAEWDEVALAEMLESLRVDSDALLASTGFDDAAVSSMMSRAAAPQGNFREADESIPTDHQCPKCGYRWSGGDGYA
jgi:ParB-like chromosome segregation protein Spo0J